MNEEEAVLAAQEAELFRLQMDVLRSAQGGFGIGLNTDRFETAPPVFFNQRGTTPFEGDRPRENNTATFTVNTQRAERATRPVAKITKKKSEFKITSVFKKDQGIYLISVMDTANDKLHDQWGTDSYEDAINSVMRLSSMYSNVERTINHINFRSRIARPRRKGHMNRDERLYYRNKIRVEDSLPEDSFFVDTEAIEREERRLEDEEKQLSKGFEEEYPVTETVANRIRRVIAPF